MDIIASHRIGLVEQIATESAALAGGQRDAVQRAIICHHVADLLGQAHGYALLAAEAALAIDGAVARLARAARRWHPRRSRAARLALGERVAAFGATLRDLDAERCADMLMAYRLVATPGLSDEAARRLEPGMLVALGAALAARGEADAALRRALFTAHRDWAEARFGPRLADAIAVLDWPGPRSLLDAATGQLLIGQARFERAERRGLARVARRLRASKLFPAAFAANPAQVFFALQRQIVERRRRAADRDPAATEDMVRLAA
jgi:hypothetical protein